MREWLRLQKSFMIENDTGYVNPIDFYKSFAQNITKSEYTFVGFEQNDASEFITILFDLLHKCLKYKIKLSVQGNVQNNLDRIAVDSINYWKKFFENEYSYLIESTYSQLLNITSCSKCDYSARNHDPIQIVTLHMKPNFKTIYDMLSHYTSVEILDSNNSWKCDKCKSNVNPEKKIVFWNLSDVLIIQIKRYDSNLRKIDTHISFPTILNMDKFCMNYNEQSMTYKLCSMSVQSGSLNGGHYYSILKRNNKWYIFNDSHIKETKVFCSDKNYCLFYRKIK